MLQKAWDFPVSLLQMGKWEEKLPSAGE